MKQTMKQKFILYNFKKSNHDIQNNCKNLLIQFLGIFQESEFIESYIKILNFITLIPDYCTTNIF